MPSKNMLRKGSRRRSVRAEYRAMRGVEAEPEVVVPVLDLDEDTEIEDGVRSFVADAAAAGMRLDTYLAQAIPEISRARVQLLIEAGQVRVDGAAAKGKQKMHGGEAIEIEGEPHPAPLHATPEDIPLDILYEDKYLAVVNKPAGMMVHAGAGATGDARNRGTLVNALLYHMAKLSEAGGESATGDRASAGQADQRGDCGSQGRCDASQAGRDVRGAASGEAIHRAAAWDAGEGDRNGESAGRAGPGSADSDDDAARGRAQCGLSFLCGGAAGDALWRVHAGGGADRDGTDAPDSRPCAVAGTSGGGRYAVRRAARDPVG